MNIDEILEDMDEMIDKSASIPFASHKKIIDGDRIREFINDLRLNLPSEIKEAKKIEFDCQRILNEAKINAEGTIRKAEERAAQLASKEAVVAEANIKAETVISEARKKATDIIRKAQEQAASLEKSAAVAVAQMLNDAEASHQKSLLDIKRTKEKLQHTLKNSPALTKDAQEMANAIFKDKK